MMLPRLCCLNESASSNAYQEGYLNEAASIIEATSRIYPQFAWHCALCLFVCFIKFTI